MIRYYFWSILFVFNCALAGLPSGNVLFLDGEGDYVQLGEPIIQNQTFTIEAFANMFGLGGGNRHSNPIFVQRNEEVKYGSSTIVLFAKDQSDSCGLQMRSSEGNLNFARFAKQNNGEWHHYAVAVALDSIFLYLDGNFIKKVPNTQQGDYNTLIDFVEIGRHTYDPYRNRVSFFYGAIDELRIWNYPRSQKQIRETLNDTLSNNIYENKAKGLVGYWRFDEISRKTAAAETLLYVQDFSTGRHDGLLVDNATLKPAAPQVHKLNSFSLIFPQNDQTIGTTTVRFEWQPTTKNEIIYPDEIQYFVYIDQSGSFLNPDTLSVGSDTTTLSQELDAGKTYFWKVLAKNIAGDSLWSANANAFFVSHTATGIERENILLPRNNLFSQNYPNPFNPGTEINYELQASGQVQIKIYDLTGRLVKVIANATQPAGAHSAQWDGTDFQGTPVAAGIYIYRIEFVGTNGKKMVQSKKMSLVK